MSDPDNSKCGRCWKVDTHGQAHNSTASTRPEKTVGCGHRGVFLHFDDDADAARETPSLLPAWPMMLQSAPRSISPRCVSPRSMVTTVSDTVSLSPVWLTQFDNASTPFLQHPSPTYPLDNGFRFPSDESDVHPLGRIEGMQIESPRSLKSLHSNETKAFRDPQTIMSPVRNREPLPLPVLTQTMTDAKGKHLESAPLTDSFLHDRISQRLVKHVGKDVIVGPTFSFRRDQHDPNRVEQNSAARLKLPLMPEQQARSLGQVTSGNFRMSDSTLGLPAAEHPKRKVRSHDSFKRLHATQTIAKSGKDQFSRTEHRRKYCMPSIVPKIPDVVPQRGRPQGRSGG